MKRKVVNGKLTWVKEKDVVTPNAKIKNATKVEVDGIKFRSRLEYYCYSRFKNEGITLNYESEKFTLIEAFEYDDQKVRPMTYTPDFTNDDVIIECKGFGNDLWPTKMKLFKKALNDKKDTRKFFVVATQKEVNECLIKIKKYYEKLKLKNQDNTTDTSDFKFIYWD